MQYYSLQIATDSQDKKEILLALLDDLGFDSFLETDQGLTATIAEEKFNASLKDKTIELLTSMEAEFNLEKIAQKNWNEIWEKNYHPVEVGSFCRIYAHFHSSQPGFQYEIQIDPKMAFGTGHHATTTLMIEAMSGIDHEGKAVLDYGAGTGILAILAEKMGAAIVTAVEIDEWAAENLEENVALNACAKVKTLHGSKEALKNISFDIILANINRNVLLEDRAFIIGLLNNPGDILLSGIITEDKNNILEAFQSAELILHKTYEKENWICLHFQHIKATN